ncbi:MAG: tyrosine-type recombinase/integrase [Rhodospirillaceae bacterium]|jgi:integrase|nr:tyrosine-type recombinase/integrase [Rhodospirillaceae bacterium]MBT5243398.1 tyrosine-type recombinase/integrase [Rhodospirillaceae bacterium]MBT5561303.1 tyrosine-type recombinase/integrase [Rhodospirillaceae bacterium]MBT6243378.1 tyrosine-type recombinase/integrase [Rhodospirillaceae bacterium]MBT7139002.1 tyrosine-type recombinase/integrase [Rhodospirillaceae bacterium]
MANLSKLQADNIKPDDKPIADGTVSGLRFHPGKEKGQGKWMMRFVSPETNKRRDMGFGVYPEVSILEARKVAASARESIRNGIDPIDARRAAGLDRKREVNALTFEKAARQCHDDNKSGWRNPKHAAQWITTLETYVFPHIGGRKIDSLKARDFADALRPIWLDKPETASRVRQRCSTVMDWCAAQDLIAGNPVGVVGKLLPKQPSAQERVKHQPAMAWGDVPKFIEDHLRIGTSNVSKKMLEFLILTAARSGETRAMTWAEVDLTDCVWTVPAERMKANKEHRVPLSGRATEILKAQKDAAAHTTLVFPSPTGGVPSDMILTKFLRDKNVESSDPGRTATAHGFRSSFRDWASENGYSRDLAERALAHTVRNQTEAAYHRTDLLEQRRGMMEAWALFVGGLEVEQTNVVAMSAKRK